MKKKIYLNIFLFISFFCFFTTDSFTQVKLSTDFTSNDKKKLPIHDVWNVANRISPRNGSNIRSGIKMNIVRMIGGIRKIVDGKPQKDLDFDPCLYDSINNTYVYRWEPLIARLNKVVNSQTDILQIALDQPPWAFQHGYTFIPEGTRDNINFRENEKISIYGNSLPPANKEAYHDFIKALMTKLVETYGEEQVLKWRFRVGSEIETPDHWYGTKQDFIEHFANTEKAVRAILPDAKVGLHTRNPDFLFRNGTVLNYKGEPYASFVEGLIDYNHTNNIKCDFWGLSDYIIIGNSSLRNMSNKYTKNFAPLINNPKWNPETTIDIMEYSTVTTMNGADGRGYITCETSHREIVELSFSNTYYRNKDKGLDFIYRWGNRTGSKDPDGIKELNSMVGKFRYQTNVSGTPNIFTNELDAIFAKNEANDEYDALIYNYNSKSIAYRNNESITISFTTDLPVATTLYYRSKSYGKENNKLQNFLIDNSNFVKSGFDNRGDPNRILTEAGFRAYQNYKNPNPHEFTEWKSITTLARTDGKVGSEITVSTEIGSFAFEKFEFRNENYFTDVISPKDIVWSTTEDFLDWNAVSSGVSVERKNDQLTLNYTEGFAFPMVAITELNIDSSLYSTLRMVVKNSTEKPDLQMAVNAPGTSFVSGRKKETIPNDNKWHTIDVDLTNWGLWTGVIEEFKVYNSVKTGGIVFDKIEFIPFDNTNYAINITKKGNGLLNYRSGTALKGQAFKLNAIPDSGWEFERWEGDATGSENPLNITVNSNMNINAIFVQKSLSTLENNFKKAVVYPNPSTGHFTVSGTILINANVSIYTFNGVKLFQTKAATNTLLVKEKLSKGLYLLKIEKNNKVSYSKIIIK